MISEKIIAAEFNGFWNDSLPLLISSFVRVFNEASSDDLTEYPQTDMRRIPIGSNIQKHDLVAELSFQLAKLSYEKSLKVEKLKADKIHIIEAYNRAIEFLRRYDNGTGEVVLNSYEIDESIELAEQYNFFLENLKSTEIEFSPKIVGAGFLGVCTADLSVGTTLYEIKTVSRNIQGGILNNY